MIRRKHIHDRLQDIELFLKAEYKQLRLDEFTARDWKAYEQQSSQRIKLAIRELQPLIDEAVSTIQIAVRPGRPHELSLNQRVTLLLVKQLFGKSNRMMACMLDLFSLLSRVDISYKTVERLYSDPEVELAISNLHELLLRKKNVQSVDASGDGTGYSLSIKHHYASKIKKEFDKRRPFVYSFKLLDLKTKLYVAYGASLISEKRAFDQAMLLLKKLGIVIDSVRLDRYYSFPVYIDQFDQANVYVIPRKNTSMNGSWKWKRTMKEFVENTMNYLREYYRRTHSEAEFSADKKRLGWKIEQKREDRITTALACTTIWHNLLNFHKS